MNEPARRLTAETDPPYFPDHTELPESDGTFVKNFQEHPQSLILTDSLTPVLKRLHPDGQYAIGQDSGIYWRLTEPPENGAVAPDWFYVPGVPPLLDGKMRRSFVLWREVRKPLIVLEFASGDGSEERDRTPLRSGGTDSGKAPGKFWVYEQVIGAPFYGIYEIGRGHLEVYHLIENGYQRMAPNERGRYPIPPLEVELGLWEGSYQNQYQLWLRWWDRQGNLLLLGHECAERESQRAEQEARRAQQEAQRAEQEAQRAEQEARRAQQEAQRAEQETQRAEQEARTRREAISRLVALGLNEAQIAEALALPREEVHQWLLSG